MASIDTIADRSTGTTIAGKAYFETSTNKFIVYNGSSWIELDSDGVSVDANTNTLTFDGTTDVVTIPNDLTLQVNGDMSICTWFQIDNHSGFQALVGKRDTSSTNYVLYVNGNQLASYDGSSVKTASATALSIGTWYHGAVVFNSGTSTLFYLNGSLSFTSSASTISANNSPLYLGNDGVGSFLDGRLDDVAIYNKALSAEEVSLVYGGALPTSNLIGLWTFEGDTGTTVTDSSTNSNNGTLSSSNMLDTTGQRS